MYNIYKVYKHTLPNGKIYIGQTKQSEKHRFRNGKGYEKCIFFYNAIQKYGWDNIITEIVASDLTLKEANWLESYLIRYYNSDNKEFGYNLAKGGSGLYPTFIINEDGTISKRKRNPLTEEHKRKISESNKGKKLSTEHRMLLSEINKGRKLSPEHIEKLRQINKTRVRTKEEIEKSVSKRRGIPLSEETKKKLSESHKGKPSWNKGKHLSESHKEKVRESSLNRKDISRPVLCVETGVVYPSANEAGRMLGITSSHISACRNGNRKSAGGYHWKYIENENMNNLVNEKSNE